MLMCMLFPIREVNSFFIKKGVTHGKGQIMQ